ncbi:hypothetical protein [Fodinicola feengrottensis]|uniref:hypothetical protein n=1 Tax=Fodinicola feengrottensis TaxID=435914 RepID=UPI002441E1D6|nr:hypothetical protein [Fodinicola feengrottensis]
MASKEDVFDSFEKEIRVRPPLDPWAPDADPPRYVADYDLLATLLAIPVRDGSGSESGRLAKAIDAWTAYELRRAGFPPDEVWPRLTKPRVLPREVGIFIDRLPRSLQPAARDHLLRNKTVAPSDARVLGRAYVNRSTC